MFSCEKNWELGDFSFRRQHTRLIFYFLKILEKKGEVLSSLQSIRVNWELQSTVNLTSPLKSNDKDKNGIRVSEPIRCYI